MKSPTFAALTLAGITLTLQAGPPVGLTVAVSQDGGKLVVGGDTRTLVVLDPATLEVKARHWVETTITKLRFSKDGSVLVVGDTDECVHLFDTTTWKSKKKLEKFENLTVAPDAGVFAGSDSAFDGINISVNSIADGAEKTKIKLAKGVRIEAMGLSADGSKLAVFTEAKNDTAEKKLSFSELPKGMVGLERDEFQQRNDGRTSSLLIFDAKTGKPGPEWNLWYAVSDPVITFNGANVVMVSYQNLNITVAPDGTTKAFVLGNSYNYGASYSASGKYILTGGLRDASITNIADLSGKKLSISKLAGWPEYFKGFDSTASEVVYGATSGFRVIKISPAGTIEKEAPIQ